MNRAFYFACRDGQRRYVYLYGEMLAIGKQRPPGRRCVVVSPERWAVMLSREAEEPP